RGAPAHQLLPGVRRRHEGHDADRRVAAAAAHEPRTDLLRPQCVLPPAVPEQVPQPHRHSGLPEGERRAELAGLHDDLHAYYLLIAGHDVTVFERDPLPGGMLRYGIPQYRLPKVEVLEAEYESIERLGGRWECNQALGRDYTLDDLQNQGYDAVCVAIGCYDTNELGIPGEDADGVLDGLDYLRTATLGLKYP